MISWLLGLRTKLYVWGGVVLGALLAGFGIYLKGRRSAQAEAIKDTYEDLIDDMEIAESIEREVDGASDADVDQQLHDHGWYRD